MYGAKCSSDYGYSHKKTPCELCMNWCRCYALLVVGMLRWCLTSHSPSSVRLMRKRAFEKYMVWGSDVSSSPTLCEPLISSKAIIAVEQTFVETFVVRVPVHVEEGSQRSTWDVDKIFSWLPVRVRLDRWIVLIHLEIEFGRCSLLEKFDWH